MFEQATVSDVLTAFLVRCGVRAAFGVISIHNMPILDAFHRDGTIRFVPSRGEAGAMNMADAYARVSSEIGVAVTSTGTGAGNACGALVEAMTAGTPLLHLTGQVESPYVGLNCGYIHEAPRQLEMMAAVSKSAYRVTAAETALDTLKLAVHAALSAPAGPVSVEIPIDIQGAYIPWPDDLEPLPIEVVRAPQEQIERLAAALSTAKRPMLWLGGGAAHAANEAQQLVDLGFGAVTTVSGRGIIPEQHANSIGAFTYHPEAEKLYRTCDALVVVGSRLRSNELLGYQLKLPSPLYRIDIVDHHPSYRADLFVAGDSKDTLSRLAEALTGRMQIDSNFASDIAQTKSAISEMERASLGKFTDLVDSLDNAGGCDFLWVRDVTLSNSIWGNRMLTLSKPRQGVHAVGGGIGQGLPMAIGATLAAKGKRVLCMVGDGGLMLNPGELATAVQEKARFTLLVMNDQGYGVIRNIQNAKYGARNCYVDLTTPDFGMLCAALQIPYFRVDDLSEARLKLSEAQRCAGPAVVEFALNRIGRYSHAFAGPAMREVEQPC